MSLSLDHPSGLLDVVFNRLDKEDIQYCLLRDIDQIPLMDTGGEVDILVRDEQLPRLTSILAKFGFACLPSWGYDPHHFFVAFEPKNGGWLKLDVISEIAYGKPIPILRTNLGVHCLRRRRKIGNYFAPSPEDELFTLLFHCILDKGQFDRGKQNRLLILCQQIREEKYLTSLLQTYLGQEMDCQQLVDKIVAGDYPSLLSQKEGILARYIKNHRAGVLLRLIINKFLRKVNKWITSLQPRSIMVALLAPDGAGKSSLATGIQESFYSPVKTIYMGLYPKKKQEQVVRRIFRTSIIWQIANLWRGYLLGYYHRLRRHLVIFDRYSYDAWLSRSNSTWVKRTRRWLLAHSCPAPDLVFLLDAPGEILYERKHEHNITFLEGQRQSYLSLQARLPQMQIIDGLATVKEVKQAVIHHIWGRIVQIQSGFKVSNGYPSDQVALPSEHKKKIAYVVSHFPKLTETFILDEMIAIEQNGLSIELFPLIRDRSKVVHPAAKPFMMRAHFQPFISLAILKANLFYFKRKPGEYLDTLFSVLKSTWGSYRLFIGSIGIFPKSVFFAYQMAVEGITHVHAHFARHATTTGFVIQRMAKIPYSFTAHGSDIHCDRHMLREKVAEADLVVPISNFNQKVILEECKGQYLDKLKVIHCGVDTQQAFKPRSWDEDIENRNAISIICIGTLHEVKGQTYLITSCKILKEAGYNVVCHFVGDGPDRPSLVKQAAQDGLDSIIFHGVLTRPEIIQMLQEMDIAVTPSVPASDGRREGIPIVVMEAMASGLPVVASNISGIPELVEDNRNGFLVPPCDVGALVAAIERLIQEPGLRRQFGMAGREKIEKEFSLQINAAKLAQYFHSDELP
jgi:glycosyltransferase involved in cell wall biosynthesis/thymidylate kinase